PPFGPRVPLGRSWPAQRDTGRSQGVYAAGFLLGGRCYPEQLDARRAQDRVALENRVRAGEIATAEARFRDEAGARRARERGDVDIRAVQGAARPRGLGHHGRLRVDRGRQVRADAAAEAVPRVTVDVGGVLGRNVVIPGGAEYLLAAPGDRAHLPPPVRAVPGQLPGAGDQPLGELAHRELFVEVGRALGLAPLPVPAQERRVEDEFPAFAEVVLGRQVPRDVLV